MPVLITGATGLVGRALAGRLLAEGAQVRAYIRRDDEALRRAGVHVALGAIDDVQRLEAALTRVHTIVHLVGGWWPERGVTYDFLNRDSTESAVIAARAAEVRRFLFLSFAGADPGSTNEFLTAKGKAEQHILDGGLEYAIFRCAPIHEALDAVFARASRGPVVSLPDGTLNPVRLDDVVDFLVAADARDAEVRGTFELGGPETVSVTDLVARSGRSRMMMPFSPAPRALADLLERSAIADPGDAVAQFGVTVSPAG